MEKIEIVMNDFSGLNNECLHNQKLIREHKLEELRKECKSIKEEASQMSVDIMHIKKEFEYREKIAKDDEIWSKILDDKKLQKKFIVIENTNKSYLRYNGNFVDFVSEPDMKKNLKTTPWTSTRIVKVSDMRMMIH